MIIFHSHSPTQTRKIGENIGHLLKAGDVVALTGDLGTGKTTLVKGIAKGLGVRDEEKVLSPSFVLIHEYDGHKKIYHIDWYRLEHVEGADARLAEECFSQEAVTLIEWAERGKDFLPKEHIEIRLEHKSPEERVIKVSALGEKYKNEITRLRHVE